MVLLPPDLENGETQPRFLWIGVWMALRWFGVLICAVGCGGAPTQEHPDSADSTSIVMAIYAAHCGACHEPVAPKSRTRVELSRALTKHRRRVRMTEKQWGELVTALAAPEVMQEQHPVSSVIKVDDPR